MLGLWRHRTRTLVLQAKRLRLSSPFAPKYILLNIAKKKLRDAMLIYPQHLLSILVKHRFLNITFS
jgi:hypothetical protein